MNTQLTIDFRAVSHARFFYKNQFGESVRTKPKVPTIHGGQRFELSAMSPYPGQPETMHMLAKRRGLLDRWTPVCILQLRNNHSLSFVGNKAKQMFKQYNQHIYG